MNFCYTHTHTGPGWLMDTKGTLSSSHPPVYIIMPQFSQHKRNGDAWFSQPFYSQPGGHKLCLCVFANGFGGYEGTHVSMCVRLMNGENDHQLQRPLEYQVTYGILNWKRDENHVIHTTLTRRIELLTFTDLFCGRLSQRYYHFSLSDGGAKDTQYLHNDCLCLQVLKVEPPKY